MIRCLAMILTVAFVLLKSLALIDWSWVWVLSPLWIYILGYVILIIVFLVIAYRSGDYDDDFKEIFGGKEG